MPKQMERTLVSLYRDINLLLDILDVKVKQVKEVYKKKSKAKVTKPVVVVSKAPPAIETKKVTNEIKIVTFSDAYLSFN